MSDLRTLVQDTRGRTVPEPPGVLIPQTQTDLRDWDYGDFPYGLEPLTLPQLPSQPVSPAPQSGPLTSYDTERTWAALELPAGADGLAVPESTDTLYWFRWITGHQVTMLIWRLMGSLLARIAQEESADDRTLNDLVSYTDGYTAMLHYTASCSPEVYQTLLRPRMYLQHRGFSGLWAADFAPLRRLLRGQSMPWITGPMGARLVAAVAANRAAHEGVAERLVPNGRSLLQQSVASAAVRPTPRTAAIFDTFFMTLRAPVGPDALVAQLLHRIRAVALDLAANGSGGPTTAEEILEPLRRVVASVADRSQVTL